MQLDGLNSHLNQCDHNSLDQCFDSVYNDQQNIINDAYFCYNLDPVLGNLASEPVEKRLVLFLAKPMSKL